MGLTLLLSGQICFFIIFQSEHVQNLISEKATRVYKYNTSSRFIDDVYARNNNNEFPKSFKFIYSGELELKLEHSGTHEIVLDLDIKIEDEIFVYKFFDKRDKF